MTRFSLTVIGGSLAGFLVRRLDTLLVGYLFDARQLGYYYLVQRLLTAVGLVTLSAVQAIVMPVLARLQDEPDKFRATFITTIRLVQAVRMPMAIGVGLAGAQLLPLLFGPQWAPSIPLLHVLCLVGFTVAFSFFTGPVLCAAGRPAAHLRLTLLQIVALAGLVVLGARFGLLGVAVAFVATTALVVPLHLAALRRDAGIPPVALLAACRTPVLATLAMAGAMFLLRQAIALTGRS